MTDTEILLNKWGVHYKDKGDNVLIRCVSGLHADKNPSLSINKDKGVFRCFSCNFTGNMNTLSKHFTGGYLDKDSYPSFFTELPDKPKRRSIPSILHKEGDILTLSGKVRKYAEEIGIYSDKFIQEYQIKYTPFSRFIADIKDDGKNKPTGYYKKLLIPIYYQGYLVNIEGRSYQKDVLPKVIYAKGGMSDLLFNFDRIDLNKPVILVEGVKDLFKVWNINKNVVACLGNGIGEIQKRQINKIKELIVFIDDDVGGRNLLNDIDSFYDKDFWVVDPSEGRDPNDLTLDEINSKLKGSVETYGEYLNRFYGLFEKSPLDW